MRSRILQPVKHAWEYLKEISGENAYDRYLAVHAATHPGKPPMVHQPLRIYSTFHSN